MSTTEQMFDAESESVRRRVGRAFRNAVALIALAAACDRESVRIDDGRLARSPVAERSSERDSIVPSFAWWIGLEFEPVDSTVLGLALASIDTTWRRATVLREDMLPARAETDRASLDEPGYGFTADGDFNHNGLEERAAVGVFETRDGERGSFLVIIEKDRNQLWAPVGKFSHAVRGRFSILRVLADGALEWSPCMECDGWFSLHWIGGGYVGADKALNRKKQEGVTPAQPRRID